MHNKKIALVGLLILFLSSFVINPQIKSIASFSFVSSNRDSSPVFLADDDIANITQDLTLNKYLSNQVISGLNYVPIMRNEIIPGDPATYNPISSGSMIFDMAGNIINYFDTDNKIAIPYNSTTMVIEKSSSADFLTLFNLYTGVEEVLPIPGNALDIVYNPEFDTFLTLNTVISTETWDGLQIAYQYIYEYNITGHLLWEWNATEYLPFDSIKHTSLGFNATYDGYADWMHANSMVWDIDNNQILLLVRNHDTIYDISENNGSILWSAGRLGDFTIKDASGQVVDSIWWHPNSLEAIGDNNYTIFDNDAYNITNPDSLQLLDGYSRYLEFNINVGASTIQEEWSFTAPNSSYYSPTSGYSERLPDGNTIGIFGNRGDLAVLLNDTHPIFFTEVNSAGEIVWEIEMQNSTEFAYQSAMIQRFYETPLLFLENDTYLLEMGESPEFNIVTWDCMGYPIDTSASLKILEGDEVVYESTFTYLAYHNPTGISLKLSGLAVGEYNFTILIENADGINSSAQIYITMELNLPLVLGILITSGIVIIAISILFIRKFLQIKESKPEDKGETPTVETEETV